MNNCICSARIAFAGNHKGSTHVSAQFHTNVNQSFPRKEILVSEAHISMVNGPGTFLGFDCPSIAHSLQPSNLSNHYNSQSYIKLSNLTSTFDVGQDYEPIK